ncbi:reverse transcriptase [Ceratobasidium theobromae]|uniref:Reverse transcriptase n=1 Tax=Ceratobasidium theobromae TaxID=1582974 RepID=A0A5N5Q8K6_9AGAM|nr:reverse transcriptase [Ceratobasidium theobromae]
MKEIRETYKKVIEKNDDAAFVILGDFNMSSDMLDKQLKPQKTGMSVMRTKGSSLTRFPKFGWCSDLDHFVGNAKAMALMRPPKVRRKYEISDHRPVMAQFRYQPLVEKTPAMHRRLDTKALKVQASTFVNHNKWQVLSEMQVETVEDLSEMTQKMANNLSEITYDLGIKVPVSSGPPSFPRKMKRLLKYKNQVAAKIAEQYAINKTPCEAQLKKLDKLKNKFQKAHKKWTKELKTKNIHQLCEDVRGNEMKRVWTRLKSMMGGQKGSSLPNPVKDKAGKLCVTQEEILRAVTEHYNHLVNGDPGTSQDEEYWKQVQMDRSMGAPKEEITDLNEDITWKDILLAVRHMKRGTAAGNDEFHVEMLKEMLNQECFEQVKVRNGGRALENIDFALKAEDLPREPLTWFGKVMYKIIIKTWELEKCPELWDEVTLCNLFKSGDPELMVNYRGISLISVGLKALISIVTNRLYTSLEKRNFFSKWQSGFRRKEEAVAQFISIAEVIRRRGINNQTTFGVFIDFKKAFDKVHHEALYRLLDHIGVRGKALNFIKALYRNAKIKVRSGGLLSDPFGMARGNRQGCPMSPILFDIFVNFLLDETNPLGVGNLIDDWCRGGQFADDLVALCGSIEQVQSFLTKLKEWCDKWGMEIGPQKSGVMMFGGSEALRAKYNETTFTAGDDEIPKVKEYKYLGIIMHEDMTDPRISGGSEEQHAKTCARRGLKKLWTMRPLLKDKDLPLNIKADLIKTFIVSSMTYGAEWLGYKANNAEHQQRILNKAMKIAMGVSSNSSLHEAFTLSYELGIPQMEVIQNGLRTRLHEKLKDGEIKTFLKSQFDDMPTMRKWTWVSTNTRWRSKFGEKPEEIPLWHYRTHTYESHVRSNNYRWPLIDKIMVIDREGSSIGMNEQDKEWMINEFLQPKSREETILQNELQVIERGSKRWPERSLQMDQVKEATLYRKMSTNKSQAWEHYNMWNLGATRGYIRTAVAYPGMNKGVSWLARIRTRGYPRVDQHWNKLKVEGKTPHFEKDKCPMCKGSIEPGLEWVHILVKCNNPKVIEKRNDFLREPMEYIERELEKTHIVCSEEPKRTRPNEFGEVGLSMAIAVLLIGGTINDWFESHYHLGFGQLDHGVRGLRTYGFVYVAAFLREVMPLYTDALYGGKKSEYKSVEVLIDTEEGDLPVDPIERICLDDQV